MGSLTTRAMKTTHAQPHHFQTAEWTRREVGIEISDNDRFSRTSASSMLRLGDEAALSSKVERLLLDVVTDGFILYCCGPRTARVL